MSTDNDSRDKYYLFGCLVELLNTLCRFSGIDSEGGSTFCALLREYALRFTNGSSSLRVSGENFLLIPGDPVITTP
jgi:hypothetical protein